MHTTGIGLWSLWLVTGCSPEPNRQPAGGDAPATTAPECDPAVVVPSPIGAVGDPAPAEDHDDTFGADPDPWDVRIGWPSSDPSRSASFVWRTGVDTLATVVEYGIDGALTERVEGMTFRFGGAADGPGDYRIHEVKLCGALEPGTTYDYRVGGDGHWSDTYTFTTPPEPGTFDTFRVAIVGDSRGAYETWGTVLATMESHDPDFFVFTGDMVELGVFQDEWDSWFAAAGDLFASKVLVPAHGNHEFLSTNYFAQFSLPHNEEWYSLQYGDLQLVVLNDTVHSVDDRDVAQVEFQQEVLGASDARWKAAVHHSAVYSSSTRHYSDEAARAAWVPVWEEHGVDFVFASHNHLYERSLPIRADQVATPEEGTTYFVTGGAGAPLYTGTQELWYTDVVNPVEHYLIADFGPTGVTFVARDLSGNVIDELTLAR